MLISLSDIVVMKKVQSKRLKNSFIINSVINIHFRKTFKKIIGLRISVIIKKNYFQINMEIYG